MIPSANRTVRFGGEQKLPPAGWSVFRIASLFREVKDKGEEHLPVLSVSIHHGISDRQLDEEERDRKVLHIEDKTSYKRIRPGDLAYNMMRAWQGAFGVAKVDGLVSPAYVVARPIRKLHPPFVEYLLRSPLYVEQMRAVSRGIADFRQRLYWEHFRQIDIALPTFATQTTIANLLDHETERIDRLIERKQQQVALLNEKERTVIAQMFAGLDARRWRVRHLGKLRNGAGFPVEQQGDPAQEIAFFKVKHLRNHGLDAYIVETDDTVSTETAKSLRATIFPPKTIVFAKVGAALLMGRFSMIGRSACLDNNMAAFIPNERLIDPSYSLLALSQIDMTTMVQPGAVPSLNTELFNSFSVSLPSREVQAVFVDRFRARRGAMQEAVSKTETSIERLREYRSALITAAVTGQINAATWKKKGETDRRLDVIEEHSSRREARA